MTRTDFHTYSRDVLLTGKPLHFWRSQRRLRWDHCCCAHPDRGDRFAPMVEGTYEQMHNVLEKRTLRLPLGQLGYVVSAAYEKQLLGRLSLIGVISAHMPLDEWLPGRVATGPCPFCSADHEIDVWENGFVSSAFYIARPMQRGGDACRAFGDAIGFTMRIKNIGFIDAIFELAELAELPPPQLGFV